ncbi:MAG TPA: DUF5996 family protein [Acidobacteriaceae bacterium]
MANAGWPELDWEQWKDTAATLHMGTQIVGKTRLALTPLQNHWWNVPLYVSARGLTTSAMPWRGNVLEVEFDFCEHLLELRLGRGAEVVRAKMELRPRSVADFYAEYMRVLRGLGVEVKIWPMPVEVAAPVRFDLDTANASYDPDAVQRFHQVLMRADTVFKRFATGFLGKISPVHFFWGSFDLAVTRFSGRPAAGPPRPDRIQQEAYSHEVISAGFWPGNGGYGAAAFYCYAAPVPDGLAGKPVRPGAWDPALGEFLLKYDDVRKAASPEDALMAFLESTYAAGADAARWDRKALERPVASVPSA